MATVLPPEHVEIFRGSHEVVSTGVARETLAVSSTDSIRLLDERWLVGEGGLLLYGDRPPETRSDRSLCRTAARYRPALLSGFPKLLVASPYVSPSIANR